MVDAQLGNQTVFCLRSTAGAGWVRELFDDRPIVTADPAEALQLCDRNEAQHVCRALNRQNRVAWRIVSVAALPRVLHGDPAVSRPGG